MDPTLASRTHQIYAKFETEATTRDVVKALVLDVESRTPIRAEELGALVEEASMTGAQITNLRTYLNNACGRRFGASTATNSYQSAAQYLASIERAKQDASFIPVEAAGEAPLYFS